MLLGILYIPIIVYFDKLKCYTVRTQDTEGNDSLQTPTQQPQAEPRESQNEQNILFSSYSLQQAKWSRSLDLDPVTLSVRIIFW
jgi:hypothetical protein